MSAAHSACDGASAQATPPSKGVKTPNPTLVLAACITASSLAMIDGSIVNVGLPAIRKALGADGAGLSWVINGFTLPLSALLLTGGAVGDRYGRRLVMLAGIGVFAAASILCALAPSLIWLIAGRVLQGVGAAFLMPASLAILGASFEGEAKGRAIGIWAAAGAAGAAGAPLLGGWLIDTVGWRATFLLNAPVALAAFALAYLFVRDSTDEERPALDLSGAALATLGLVALTWGLTEASARTGPTPVSLAALGAGAAALIAFLFVEHRKGDRAMAPLSLFASPSFAGLTGLTLLLYGALSAVLVLVPYLLIELKHYPATAAGAALLPLPVVIAVVSPFMGRIAARIGSRLPLTVGPLVVAAGFVAAFLIPSDGPYALTVLPALVLISVGMAAAVAPLTTAVLSSVSKEHTGTASGLNSAVARTGGLIATALLGVVLSARGPELAALFRVACAASAACAVAAAACAFIGLRNETRP